MKKLLYSLIIILFPLTSFSQEVEIKEPQYLGNICFINSDFSLTELEKQRMGSESRANAATYVPVAGAVAGRGKSSNTVDKAQSPIRIKKANEYTFIAKVNDNRIDPFDLFNIFKLESNNRRDFRTIEVARTSRFGGTRAMQIDYIPFSAKKHGESSFIITITEELEAG